MATKSTITVQTSDGTDQQIYCTWGDMSESYKILSIDAWREEFGWNWNNWFNVGEITKECFNSLKTNRATLKWFRDAGFLSDASKGRVKIESDGYNVVVCAKSNGRPLFAIEVGE